MRYALGLFGVVAAGVLLLVSGAMNWRFGYSLGASELDGQILGLASAASDGLKALIPFFLFAALRNKQWSHAMAATVLWGICLSYSLTSALGFSALNRADTTGTRTVQATAYTDMRSELDRTRERLGWVPEHRPAATVASALDGLKTDRRWTATQGCTDATATKSRAFCQEVHQLGAELAAAEEADKLEARASEVMQALAALPAATVQASADPQAEVLARLSGQSTAQVQTALIILVAMLVELGSALGFYVVFSQWRIFEDVMPVVVARPKVGANDNATMAVAKVEPVPAKVAIEAAPVALPAAVAAALPSVAPQPVRLGPPGSDVERFYRERVSVAEGSSLTATALYEDYCDWCDDNSKEPMALPTFGRQFGELGVQKAKIAGRIRYIGISLTAGVSEDDGEARVVVAA